MSSLIKLFLLFNGLILISGLCPDTPTVQTTSINTTNPVVLTKDTVGLVANFPTLTATKKQLDLFGTFKIEETCTGVTLPASKSLLSITVTTSTTSGSTTTTTENELLRLYIDCANLKVETSGVWATSLGTTVTRSAVTAAADIKDTFISIFLAIDLDKNYYSLEYLTSSYHDAHLVTMSTANTWAFDNTTKIYLCAAKGGSQNSCLASDVKIGYTSVITPAAIPANPFIGYVGGTTPTLGLLYPLYNGSLAKSNTGTLTGTAYFGNSATTPTAATVASWDTSGNFVKLSTFGQILTVPLPTTLSAANAVTSKTLAVSAWVKITTLPAKSTTSTIISMHKASDATDLGFKLLVSQTTNDLSLMAGTTAAVLYGTAPKITLDTWTLVGFSVSLSVDNKNALGTFFAGSSSVPFDIRASATAIDLQTAALLRVGSVTADNGFTGNISTVKIMTPAAGFIQSTSTCSATNKIELGLGSFGLSCADNSNTNINDGKCYATCPDGTLPATGAAVPFCVSCPEECATCDSTGCLSCRTEDVLYQSDCLDKCPRGTYLAGRKCLDCKAGCDACNAGECFACNILKGYIAEPNNGVCILFDPKAGTGPGVAGLVCAGLILIAYLIYAYNSEENLSIYGSKQNVGFKSVANYQN